jgi:hypothetical protein
MFPLRPCFAISEQVSDPKVTTLDVKPHEGSLRDFPLERNNPLRRYLKLERVMQTPKEHRQHAAECLELARAANEFYVKSALIELAAEFNKLAEQLERTERRRASC